MPTSFRQICSPQLWFIPAIVVLTISGIPVIVALILSLLVQCDNVTPCMGLDAYARLYSGPYVDSLYNILWQAVIVASTCVIFAFPVGYFIVIRRSLTIRIGLIALALAPFFTSDAIRSFGWLKILSAGGILSKAVVFLSGGLLSSQILCFSDIALFIALASAVFPFGLLAIIVSLPKASDPRWQVSAELGGSRRWTFFHLALPNAMPGALVGWIYMVVLATFSSTEEHYVGNSTSMQKITSGLINSDVSDRSYQFFALTSTILFVLIGLILIAAGLFFYRSLISSLISKWIINVTRYKKRGIEMLKLARFKHSYEYPKLSPTNNRNIKEHSDNSFNFIIWTISILCYLLILAPLITTVALSMQDYSTGELLWTFCHYKDLFHAQSLTAALGRSILLGLGVGFSCLLMAPLLATSKWLPKKIYVPGLMIIAIASLIPPDSYSIALLNVVRFLGIQSGSLWLVAIGHIAWAMPFCVGTMILSYSALNVHMLQAAMEFEPKPFSLWLRIIVRLTIPAIFGCFIFGFLLSLNDSIRGIYLGGSAELLSNRVYGRLLSGLAGSGRRIFACGTMVVMFSFFSASAVITFIAHSSRSRE